MKLSIACSVLALSLLTAATIPADLATLQMIASFPDQQVTGVAVSKQGRVFVNFPDWSDPHTLSVAEVIDGKPVPYPSEEWNGTGGAPGKHFVCVQSVYVDESDSLWILDPAAPKMKEIVKGGPKLVKVDLVKNAVVQTIPFSEEIAPKKSYLNDVRVDTKTQTAFITDSGLGAIVVDLRTEKARRLLEGDHSTQVEKDFKLQVKGHDLLGENGKPPQIHSDGIALDRLNGLLYFHALTGQTLYRTKTPDLLNSRLTKQELATKVETVTETPAPDGMIMGSNGKLYLTDIEHGAVVAFDPKDQKLTPIASDGRLSWPDSLAWGPDGSLYVTTSQIQEMPRFNGGKDMRKIPYHVYKIVGALAGP